MVELETKVTESGVLYIPKPIRDAFGRNLKIIASTRAALFFPEGTEYEDVLASLGLIHLEIQHRIALRDKKKMVVKTE